MKKYSFFILILIFVLIGCQSKSVNSEVIHDEAENIYTVLTSNFNNKESLSKSEKEDIDSFRKNYIEQYKEFESDKEIISEMEGLINSYNFYYVAVGLNEKDDIEMYKERFEQSVSNLEEQFNK